MSKKNTTSKRVVRTCACGCDDCELKFEVSETSRKVYFNRRHKENAKDQRRKLAPVTV